MTPEERLQQLELQLAYEVSLLVSQIDAARDEVTLKRLTLRLKRLQREHAERINEALEFDFDPTPITADLMP